MRLTVKSLDGKQFVIEVEPDIMVEDLKSSITQIKPEMVVARQKLVYQGRVLADGKPLSSYGVAENQFVVCMLVKPTAEQRAAAEAAAAAEEEAALGQAQEDEEEEDEEVSVGGEAEEEGYEQMVLDQAVVNQLVQAMGFPEDQVRAALQAAYNDPDLAVEYLMTGIPEGQGDEEEDDAPMSAAEMQQVQAMLQQAVANAGGAAASAMAIGGGAAAAAAPAAPATGGVDLMSVDLLAGLTGSASQPQPPQPSPLAALRQHPQFNQLKALVQANPAMLTQVMQQIGSQSPEMIEAIQNNPDEFLAMLNEPLDGVPPLSGSSAAAAVATSSPAAAASATATLTPSATAPAAAATSPASASSATASAAVGGGAAAGATSGVGAVAGGLTAADQEAITRLEALGFSRAMVVEAYLACEKNENATANILFDSM